MASTLPPQASADRMVFIPPTKRSRTASGKTNTFTPTRNGPTRSVYGDQILNVQVGRVWMNHNNLYRMTMTYDSTL